MQRNTLVAVLGLTAVLNGGLGQPLEAQQGTGVFTESTEPAPIQAGQAPHEGEYSSAFDALHYDIHLTLPLAGAVIAGTTEITLAVAGNAPDTLALDFTGLAVTSVRIDGVAARFVHEAGKLRIPLPGSPAGRDRTLRIAVDYTGTPDDGLIIRDNVHGQRSVFADNWPNRARFWFPSLDYPSDKATASITVLAPPGWDVVANGTRDGEPSTVQLRDGSARRQVRWKMDTPISPYNMVIGAADFRIQTIGRPCFAAGRCVDVTTWIFPESAARAAPSFRRAAEIIEYFSQLIAPFPYQKLAHVQSSTQFGGMENATAIFYDEKPLASGQNIELTVAHETAHQWFGDAVTEAQWRDLWLSEGFATYFAALFVEHADGAAAFHQLLEDERRRVVAPEHTGVAIVAADAQDLFKLLNIENYDKGSWVLHMLRGMLGDERFFDGIRRYYREHENGTATTADLQHAMETVSGINLEPFFDQWLLHPGFPRFRVSSQWDTGQRLATVVVEQVQPGSWPTFTLPLTIELTTASATIRRRIDMDERIERFTVPLDSPPVRIVVDPDGWVLKDIERP